MRGGIVEGFHRVAMDLGSDDAVENVEVPVEFLLEHHVFKNAQRSARDEEPEAKGGGFWHENQPGKDAKERISKTGHAPKAAAELRQPPVVKGRSPYVVGVLQDAFFELAPAFGALAGSEEKREHREPEEPFWMCPLVFGWDDGGNEHQEACHDNHRQRLQKPVADVPPQKHHDGHRGVAHEPFGVLSPHPV